MIKDKLFSKDQELNTLKAVEVITLLDLTETIHEKMQHMQEGHAEIYLDNRKIVEMINEDLEIVNNHVQDGAAQAKEIIKMIEEAKITIVVFQIKE